MVKGDGWRLGRAGAEVSGGTAAPDLQLGKRLADAASCQDRSSKAPRLSSGPHLELGLGGEAAGKQLDGGVGDVVVGCTTGWGKGGEREGGERSAQPCGRQRTLRHCSKGCCRACSPPSPPIRTRDHAQVERLKVHVVLDGQQLGGLQVGQDALHQLRQVVRHVAVRHTLQEQWLVG